MGEGACRSFGGSCISTRQLRYLEASRNTGHRMPDKIQTMVILLNDFDLLCIYVSQVDMARLLLDRDTRRVLAERTLGAHHFWCSNFCRRHEPLLLLREWRHYSVPPPPDGDGWGSFIIASSWGRRCRRELSAVMRQGGPPRTPADLLSRCASELLPRGAGGPL
jgi:hypothetical protein